MRTFPAALATLFVLATATPALAQDAAGTYDAKFEEVANNCSALGVGISRTKGKLSVRKGKRDQIMVDLERIPVMVGTIGKNGSLRAQSKLGPSGVIEKLDAKYSIAGQVAGGELSLVFVAEYFDRGAAMCSQTWNVSGTREATAKSTSKAPSAGSR